MAVYTVNIITRDLEKHSYLIEAESVISAKEKALGKLYNFYEAEAPYKELIVSKIEDLWVPMG